MMPGTSISASTTSESSSTSIVSSLVTVSGAILGPSLSLLKDERPPGIGIFKKKLEPVIGFYRERDKYYYLKKQYAQDDTKLNMIKEMWQARERYQLRKRFKWPPNFFWGKMFWSSGYYEDFWKKSHATKVRGFDGEWEKVEVPPEADNQDPESSDEDDNIGVNQVPLKMDRSNWTTIYERYLAWKKHLLSRHRVAPSASDIFPAKKIEPQVISVETKPSTVETTPSAVETKPSAVETKPSTVESQLPIPTLEIQLQPPIIETQTPTTGKQIIFVDRNQVQFRNELDNVDFDPFEDEILRKKSRGYGLLNSNTDFELDERNEERRRKSRRSQWEPKRRESDSSDISVPKGKYKTITFVTNEYTYNKDPNKPRSSSRRATKAPSVMMYDDIDERNEHDQRRKTRSEQILRESESELEIEGHKKSRKSKRHTTKAFIDFDKILGDKNLIDQEAESESKEHKKSRKSKRSTKAFLDPESRDRDNKEDSPYIESEVTKHKKSRKSKRGSKALLDLDSVDASQDAKNRPETKSSDIPADASKKSRKSKRGSKSLLDPEFTGKEKDKKSEDIEKKKAKKSKKSSDSKKKSDDSTKKDEKRKKSK